MGTEDQGAYRPLANDEHFAHWRSPRELPTGSITFGHVLKDLLCGVSDFLREERRTSYECWTIPIVLGCVPWMSNEHLTAEFAKAGGCCIVMTKGAGDLAAAEDLIENGHPLPTRHFGAFDEIGVRGPVGEVPTIGPGGLSAPLAEVGPVRMAGWKRPGGGSKGLPLVHAKLLVLGDAWADEKADTGPVHAFTAKRAWLGSSNWTGPSAAEHLEFGLWTDEPTLVAHTTEFLLDLINYSEPFQPDSNRPNPEFAEANWDDQAFADYLADTAESET